MSFIRRRSWGETDALEGECFQELAFRDGLSLKRRRVLIANRFRNLAGWPDWLTAKQLDSTIPYADYRRVSTGDQKSAQVCTSLNELCQAGLAPILPQPPSPI